jgi:methyl-accepting chemotaxis protein
LGVIGIAGIIAVGLFLRKVKTKHVVRKEASTDSSREIHGSSRSTRTGTVLVSMESFCLQILSHFGVTGKIILSFAGLTILFGVVTAALVYHLWASAINTQISQRLNILTAIISDSAAKHLSSKDLVGLRKELSRHAALAGLAYITVADDKGRVLASSVENLSVRVGGSNSNNISEKMGWTTLTYAGALVYETRAGILDGRLGTVHLGVLKAAVDSEIEKAILPITSLLLVMVLFVIAIFAIVVRRVSRPLRQLADLAQSARRISMGELDVASGIKDRGEIGELARSIERMRSSLKAAMNRVEQRVSS